jgi:hypothetical protein
MTTTVQNFETAPEETDSPPAATTRVVHVRATDRVIDWPGALVIITIVLCFTAGWVFLGLGWIELANYDR